MDFKEIENQLIEHEDIRLFPYLDTVGKTTIGIGRNLSDRGITLDEAMYLMRNDIILVISQLEKFIWYVDQPVNIQIALINMCFNLGLTRLLGFKKMLSALMTFNYEDAANEALDSLWAQQVGQRAEEIASIIRETNANRS